MLNITQKRAISLNTREQLFSSYFYNYYVRYKVTSNA